MEVDYPSVIIDDEPLLEREDRPRSRTWPILPPPIETIHEHERDAEIAEPPPIIEEVEPEEEATNDTLKAETNPRKNSRKNAWGNLSYADLITQAIQSSPEQRLTLSQIYEWMVRNIPYFKDKGDSTSSAGWKNSIRHNLSLHSRFMRVQNDTNGKSSYWVINPDAKPGKSSRRRSGSVDGQPKGEKNKRIRNKKLHQSTDDISSLSPNSIKLKQNRSYENLFAASPCSSTDSLSNLEEFHSDLQYAPYTGESFARPRSTSNVSTQSSVNGSATPTHTDLDDIIPFDDNQVVVSGLNDEVESMSIDSQVNTMTSTINLNDSLKYTGNNDTLMQPRRPHSDSFGSGDSGYESPAASFLSPPIQQVGNRTMPKLPSPTVVPNKPPPPYNNGFHPQMRQQQLRQDMTMPGFYHQSNMNSQQARMNMINNHVPRLKHLPMVNQNGFPSQPPQASLYPQQQRMAGRNFVGVQNTMFDNYLMSNGNMAAPNVTVDNKLNHFQQQQHTRKNMFSDISTDIPVDLHQVELFDFDDQQQLASDLAAIIKNDLKESSLQQIGFKNDTNNNTKGNTFNQQPSVTTSFPGQHWVR